MDGGENQMGKRRKPKRKAHQQPKISWNDILVRALVDLLIGTVLILIGKLIG